MLTTTAFAACFQFVVWTVSCLYDLPAACFQFVVWTVSCLYDLPVQSLHLPSIATGLGSGLPRC